MPTKKTATKLPAAPKAKPSKEERKLRKHLTDLTETLILGIVALDTVMQQPASKDRGQRVSAILNQIEMANDAARYFGLGINYRTDKKKVSPGLELRGPLGHAYSFTFGPKEQHEHVVLIRDDAHPGLWIIRNTLGFSGTPSAWTRDEVWEIEQRPLTKAFIKRGRWTFIDGWEECKRIIEIGRAMK